MRDVCVRSKYLPMVVLRRLDAVLEDTRQAVLKQKAKLDRAKIVEQGPALCQAAGQAFYNTSPFTMRDLRARARQQQADFEAWLDGYSPNVQEILDNFEFRSDTSIRLPGLDNYGIGTLFEELVRRFNEENNEEAGEHWPPPRCCQTDGPTHLPAARLADQIRNLPAL